jgi:hypothetical protein
MTESTAASQPSDRSLSSVSDCLSHSLSRAVLGTLYEQAPAPVSVSALVSKLADSDPELTPDRARIAVHHTHLPRLESAGLVERGADGLTISDHPAFEDEGIVDAITTPEPDDAPSRDRLFSSLASARNRLVLDVLSHQFQAIHTETLAREVAAREAGVPETSVPADDVERVYVALYHAILPSLDDAGLVAYDRDAQRVESEGHPELRVPWMHSVFTQEFRASLTGESEPQELATIEGREQVISFGQSLGDRADEELFCMFTHRDMLEAGCFSRIVDAAHRGVNVYLGTYDPTVREFVEKHAPEVTLWEPKTDWLNLPVEGNRVGRLLMADREALMLGTLLEDDGTGVPAEKAIIGEGADNTLVVMVRQMVIGHLEEDDTADDIEQHLTF